VSQRLTAQQAAEPQEGRGNFFTRSTRRQRRSGGTTLTPFLHTFYATNGGVSATLGSSILYSLTQ